MVNLLAVYGVRSIGGRMDRADRNKQYGAQYSASGYLAGEVSAGKKAAVEKVFFRDEHDSDSLVYLTPCPFLADTGRGARAIYSVVWQRKKAMHACRVNLVQTNGVAGRIGHCRLGISAVQRPLRFNLYQPSSFSPNGPRLLVGRSGLAEGTFNMSVQLNHTIIWCRNKQISATFLTDVLGLPPAVRFGPMLVVHLHNGISLDFYEKEGEISSQHYAFLIDEADFEQIFARICDKGIQYWADPGKHRTGEINRNDGGRGVYFDDPDGHLLEIITRPYGSTA
jgi:catechol 2,3-dioxygenase-like lactoylglutathione lyase family enzyme